MSEHDSDALREASRPELKNRWPLFEGEPENMRGLDAFLVVLRYIHSRMPQKFSMPFDEDLLAVKLARVAVTDEVEESLKRLKLRALRELADSQEEQSDELGFLDVAQHPRVYEGVWSREPYLLFETERFVRVRPAQDYRKIKPDEPGKVARRSLIQHDGTRSLEESINTQFGTFTGPEGRYEFLGTSRGPTLIRVLYTPEPSLDSAAPKFKDVRRFCIWYRPLHEHPDAKNPAEIPLRRNMYTLAAAVGLRQAPRAADTVRLYLGRAEYQCPPDLALPEGDRVTSRITGARPNIGDPGTSFMLFYGMSKADERLPSEAPEYPGVPIPQIECHVPAKFPRWPTVQPQTDEQRE